MKIKSVWVKFALVLTVLVPLVLLGVGGRALSAGPGDVGEAEDGNGPATIHVPGNYPTIQAGIDAAFAGDTVLVASGTYTEHLTMKSGVRLVCGETTQTCIITEEITPTLSSALITCTDCNADTLIENFTVQGADGHEDAYGVGIALVNSEARVYRNHIFDNSRFQYSGAALIAFHGQGIQITDGGRPRIIANYIYNNRAYSFGGGLSVDSASGAVVYGNIFDSNRIFNWGPDVDGGGLATASDDVFISNNVFVGNVASGNADDKRGGGVFIAPGVHPLYVGNNIFMNNLPYAVESDHYSDLAYNLFYLNDNAVPGTGPGNIFDQDPEFVNPGLSDYHLQGTSPAIDHGDPAPNFNDPEDPGSPGNALYPALGGLRNDMGAYGGRESTLEIVPLYALTLDGPQISSPNIAVQFTASVTPITATLPVTYTWDADAHDPMVVIDGHSFDGYFGWETTGTFTLTVSAAGPVNTFTKTHTIVITDTIYTINLPLVVREGTCWAENHTTPTTCAEEDNVNIPVFAPESNQIVITATHPTYPWVTDNCLPDFSGCDFNHARATAGVNDTCTGLFDNGDVVVQGCSVPEWWRPYTVHLDVTGGSSGDYHYLVLYKKIAGDPSIPQFLVLYQDGYLRMKPHPEVGVPDVCFGSSVIVGPLAEFPSARPYTDISTILVDPAQLTLDLTYRNGGTAQFSLSVDRIQAVAVVDINYFHSSASPAAVFRSMYVADGNADMDHVRNQHFTYGAGADWTTLYGPAWDFYRVTESIHNTSAPDFSIEVSETE